MKADIKNVMREFDFLAEVRAEKGPGTVIRKYYIVLPRELVKLGLKEKDLVEVKIKKIGGSEDKEDREHHIAECISV